MYKLPFIEKTPLKNVCRYKNADSKQNGHRMTNRSANQPRHRCWLLINAPPIATHYVADRRQDGARDSFFEGIKSLVACTKYSMGYFSSLEMNQKLSFSYSIVSLHSNEYYLSTSPLFHLFFHNRPPCH